MHVAMAMTTADLLRHMLMYLVVPLWFAVGLADYGCHRAALIERTSGPKESVLHLVQFGQAGAGLLVALFLVTNAAVLVFLVVCFLAHQATSIWDVGYANATRRVGPTEQHVHTVLEAALPVTIGIAAVMDWPAARSGFAIELRQPALPAWFLAALTAGAILVAAAYGEELLRTLRWRHASKS
jgi:hypothetical protein